MGRSRNGEVFEAGELEVRPEQHLAIARGRVLALSVRELGLLAALARRRGRVVSREELFETVWGGELRATDRSVDVYVHKLRAKLGEAIPEQRFIHTHFGFGYRFEPEPAVGGEASDPPASAATSHLFHSAATGT
jgi:DNA-binding response OmpR family regulator